MYTLDAKASHLPEDQWYPKSLSQITENGYFTEQDLEKLTKEFRVFYTYPNKDYKSDTIILLFLKSDSEKTFVGEIRKDFSFEARPAVELP